MAQMGQNTTNPAPPPYYYMKPQKTRWWVPVIITLAIIFGLIFLGMAIIGSIGSAFSEKQYVLKSNSVLYLNYGYNMQETAGPIDVLGSGSSHSNFGSILSAIKRAKDDDMIEGIYYKAAHTQMGFAKAMEIQEALDDFRESGKFVYAYIELGNEMDYFNALAADKIFMQPESIIEFNGFNASSMFFKGLFDKLGIEFYVEGFEDFKSAGDMYSRTSFSDSSRYQLVKLLEQRHETFVDQIAKYRKMDKQFINSALNRGIYYSDSMKTLGFVDDLATEMDVKQMMKDIALQDDDREMQVDQKLHFVSVGDYLSSSHAPMSKKAEGNHRIAIINASGTIKSGLSNESPFNDETAIYADTYCKYLKEVREDDDIEAVILRIDSPGGSGIASESIWQEILKLKEVKPVYACMSDVAASGGYYIAMGCDTIICHPNTITGSIGVISAIPNFKGLLDKIGVSIDTISTADNAQFMSPAMPLRDSDKAKFREISKAFYYSFVSKVANARGMDFETARSLAKGRVWTGQKAYEHGLVDVLGGMETALDMVKTRIGVPADKLVDVEIYPKQMDKFQAFLDLFGLSEDDSEYDDMDFNHAQALAKKLGPAQYQLIETMPEQLKQKLYYTLELMQMAEHEQILMALPDNPAIVE